MDERERRRRDTRCSFCGKEPDQVRKLVAGPGIYICNHCITLCSEVLDEDARSGGSTDQPCAPPPGRATKGSFWKRLFWSRNWRAMAT